MASGDGAEINYVTEVQPGAVALPPQTEAQILIENFWPKINDDIIQLDPTKFKTQELPLARIKKIMKLDEDVKMISQEAPALFAKACELFITELTLRGWLHTEENKRRTLQKSDISMAVSKYDQFDFLIDIVPREEVKPAPKREETGAGRTASMPPEQVQYFFQLAQTQQQQQQQQQQQGAQQQTAAATAVQIQGGLPAGTQVVQIGAGGNAIPLQVQNLGGDSGTAAQVLQLVQQQQANAKSQQVAMAAASQQAQQPQVLQQIITNTGEIATVPVSLTPHQLQQLQMQLQQGSGLQVQQQLAGASQQQQVITLDASVLQAAMGGGGGTVFLQQPQTSTSHS